MSGVGDEEYDFDTGSSGAAQSFPMQCSALRKNGFVLINNHPCKIVEMSTSKTGKHGHAKVHMVGIEIFDGKKCEDICPSTHNMQVPRVTRKEIPCMSIDDENYMSLLQDDGVVRSDIKASDEIAQEINDLLDVGEEPVVTVVAAMGTEKAMSVKKGTNK